MYLSPTCHRCKGYNESFTHVLTCSKNGTSIQTIIEKVVNYMARKYGLTSIDTTELTNKLMTTHITCQKPPPIAIIHKTCKLPKRNKLDRTKDPTIYLYRNITKAIRNKIWKPRCAEISHEPSQKTTNNDMSSGQPL